MLSDRPYMRDSYSSPKTSVLVWLISAVVAGFVLQTFMERVFSLGANPVDGLFGLTPLALAHGRVWTLVTTLFLHDSGFQMFCYVLSIYFMGRELLPLTGPRRFLALFFGSGILGGLTWCAVHWGAPVFAASGCGAVVSALLVVFACFYPDREIQLLLFWVLPVTVKPKHLAFALLGITLFGFAFYELYHAAAPVDISYSAKLGGMAAGWLYYRYVQSTDWGTGARADIELPRWMTRRAKAPVADVVAGSPASPADLRAEVDRILDKINSQGFGALTAQEKRLLDTAKDSLSRR